MLVKVTHIPVRYENKTYVIDESFEIKDEHYPSISDYVDIIEESKEENQKDNSELEKYLDDLSYNDLKSYLKEEGLKIGSLKKHKDILAFAKEQLI